MVTVAPHHARQVRVHVCPEALVVVGVATSPVAPERSFLHDHESFLIRHVQPVALPRLGVQAKGYGVGFLETADRAADLVVALVAGQGPTAGSQQMAFYSVQVEIRTGRPQLTEAEARLPPVQHCPAFFGAQGKEQRVQVGILRRPVAGTGKRSRQ